MIHDHISIRSPTSLYLSVPLNYTHALPIKFDTLQLGVRVFSPPYKKASNLLYRERATRIRAARSGNSDYKLLIMMEDDPLLQMTGEFKTAARSLATMYKLSTQNGAQMKKLGYLECLEDLLLVLKDNENVEDWALRKKLELMGCQSGVSVNNVDIVYDKVIPSDFSFTMSSPMGQKFPPSTPSVERMALGRPKRMDVKDNDKVVNTDEDIMVEQLDDSLKRRIIEENASKKPKH